MSWAQPRGADRDKLNDIAPIWTSLLVCSVVRCKLLLPGRFQCQDMWARNKWSKNMNFSSQLKYESNMNTQRMKTRNKTLCSVSVWSIKWMNTFRGLVTTILSLCGSASMVREGIRHSIVQLHEFEQLLNSYGSFNWWGQ